MSAQTYTDKAARSRMQAGRCPECGYGPTSHDGGGGPGWCTLTDNGVAARIDQYRREEQDR